MLPNFFLFFFNLNSKKKRNIIREFTPKNQALLSYYLGLARIHFQSNVTSPWSRDATSSLASIVMFTVWALRTSSLCHLDAAWMRVGCFGFALGWFLVCTIGSPVTFSSDPSFFGGILNRGFRDGGHFGPMQCSSRPQTKEERKKRKMKKNRYIYIYIYIYVK